MTEASKRTHKKQKDAANRGKTPAQLRQESTARAHSRQSALASQRREEATERLAAWQAKSPAQQIAALDARLGKGVGAKRQRARLKT
jgi:hypothetical protein